MPFNALPGDTLLLPPSNTQKEHLYVVVIGSFGDPKKTIIVNLTTKRSTSDTTVFLQSNQHSFIKHPTVVAYSYAQIVETGALITYANSKENSSHQSFDQNVLSIIQEGILKSDFTPNEVKAFYKAHHY